jgi:hypothetical protein
MAFRLIAAENLHDTKPTFPLETELLVHWSTSNSLFFRSKSIVFLPPIASTLDMHRYYDKRSKIYLIIVYKNQHFVFTVISISKKQSLSLSLLHSQCYCINSHLAANHYFIVKLAVSCFDVPIATFAINNQFLCPIILLLTGFATPDSIVTIPKVIRENADMCFFLYILVLLGNNFN